MPEQCLSALCPLIQKGRLAENFRAPGPGGADFEEAFIDSTVVRAPQKKATKHLGVPVKDGAPRFTPWSKEWAVRPVSEQFMKEP
jgi:hypothetical protein